MRIIIDVNVDCIVSIWKIFLNSRNIGTNSVGFVTKKDRPLRNFVLNVHMFITLIVLASEPFVVIVQRTKSTVTVSMGKFDIFISIRNQLQFKLKFK